ncbi:hypothetical protein SDC9_06946 [bioreactor metagenome]|uniref:Uncharacterized protein n=1 Tax=bioreactor metagenome TaxID=1076179 RepID=A0A644T399_9ZZZZ|nr:hypothetical protein [Dehalococcoides sp.]
MRQQWLVWLAFTYIVGQFMCLILEGTWLGDPEQSFFNALLGFSVMQYSDSVLGNLFVTVVNIVGGVYGLLTYAIPRLLFWDYSFLTGTASLAKWLFFYPVSAGTVWGLYTSLRR